MQLKKVIPCRLICSGPSAVILQWVRHRWAGKDVAGQQGQFTSRLGLILGKVVKT